jgi:glycosyltransferase involved in cell wall biosynthesis
MKVSALIITYNQERYIAAAIDSALMQETDSEYEIVISEDCSSDGTRAIVRDYEARFPRIRARYSPRNLGAAENFVRAYHACQGEYIAMLEGDDYWISPQKLQKQAAFLDRHPECSMCAHGVIKVVEGRRPSVRIRHELKEISTLEDLLLDNFVYTCSAMLRKEAFDDYPSWVYDAPSSDYALWVQAAGHGDIGYIKECLSAYRDHGSGVWSGKDPVSQVEAVIEVRERIIRDLGSGYDHVFERVLARFYGQLACERAAVPNGAVVLVASGGDEELLKLYRPARHFPSEATGGLDSLNLEIGDLIESLEHCRAEGGEFLLFPRTALAWIDQHELRQYLDNRYLRVSDSPEALLYDLRDGQ